MNAEKQIDVVVPFVRSANRDKELKWAIKGFRKFLTGLRLIHVIGDKPVSDVNGTKVVNLSQEHYSSEWKEREIFKKLMLAVNSDWCSDPFLYANDDHFLLKPFSAPEFPFFHSGVHLSPTIAGSYAETVRNTKRLLGDPYTNFDVHTPILIYKNAFLKAFENVDWKRRYGYCIKSVYVNRSELDVPVKYTPDCKLVRRQMTYEEIWEKIRGRELFSIGEHCLGGGMQEVFKELYEENPL